MMSTRISHINVSFSFTISSFTISIGRHSAARKCDNVAILVQTDAACTPRPANTRRCPALGAGKSLAIGQPHQCAGAHVYAAALYVVGGPMDPIGLAGAMC